MVFRAVNLPYLVVDGHARMALRVGRRWRHRCRNSCCAGRSWNVGVYAYIKIINKLKIVIYK